jgi:hypothetical protein
MVRKFFSIFLFLLISSNVIYGKDFNSLKNELVSVRNIEASSADNPNEDCKIHNDFNKREKCSTILGISYASAMIGVAVGVVGGLFWAFYNKNKIASMAVCISGSGMFLLGMTIGLITSNIYCRDVKLKTKSSVLEKYDFMFSYNFTTKDYTMAFSYRL